MKARPKLTPDAHTKWVGRRGGSWYNMGVVNPALSQDYQTHRGDNHLGFRTVLNHRAQPPCETPPGVAVTALKYRNNDVPRAYIGGSFRVTDPDGLTVRPSQLANSTFRALPMLHNKYMGFRTTLNYKQERSSPEYP